MPTPKHHATEPRPNPAHAHACPVSACTQHKVCDAGAEGPSEHSVSMHWGTVPDCRGRLASTLRACMHGVSAGGSDDDERVHAAQACAAATEVLRPRRSRVLSLHHCPPCMTRCHAFSQACHVPTRHGRWWDASTGAPCPPRPHRERPVSRGLEHGVWRAMASACSAKAGWRSLCEQRVLCPPGHGAMRARMASACSAEAATRVPALRHVPG